MVVGVAVDEELACGKLEFDEFDTVVASAVMVIGCCWVETTIDATDVDGVDEIETDDFCGCKFDVSITFATEKIEIEMRKKFIKVG